MKNQYKREMSEKVVLEEKIKTAEGELETMSETNQLLVDKVEDL